MGLNANTEIRPGERDMHYARAKNELHLFADGVKGQILPAEAKEILARLEEFEKNERDASFWRREYTNLLALNSKLRSALERIASRKPNQNAAAAAFYRCRKDAQEVLRSDK